MDYLTVKETAEKWGLSVRSIQQLCTQGRIPGARKFGKSWAIPANAEKSQVLRASQTQAETVPEVSIERQMDNLCLMPLMNTSFQPGSCLQTIEAMPAGPKQDIAWAEYHYFSGQAEMAVKEVSPYLTHDDLAARLSACLIYAYANLSLGQISQARAALGELNASLAAAGKQSPPFRAASAFVASAGAVLLHLPLPEQFPETQSILSLLPPGLRAFSLYVQAHYLYLKGEYGLSAGMVEATLAMGAVHYPIPALYLHLVAVMNYMSLKQKDKAEEHLLAAWELARPDDLLEGFGEHHGLLGGMLEAVIKPNWPEDFKRIIAITYRFSAGWRKIHNPETGHNVADDLTTTEFAVAMLAARGWTNREIAGHLKISSKTVKQYLDAAREKLHVSRRQDLKKYMLR